MEPLESFLGAEFKDVGSLKRDKMDDGRYFDVAHLRQSNGNKIARCSFKNIIEIMNRQRSFNLSPIFVSYYTPATPYEALASQLKRSLDRFGLEHRIEPILSLGSWVANTGLKSAFIEQVWRDSDRPICWVDADAELLRSPQFLFGNPFDFAVVRRHGWYVMSGVAYFGKSSVAGEVISRWRELCHQYPFAWDQVLLTLAWYNVAQNQKINTMYLPDGIFRFPRPFIRDLRDKIFYYPRDKKIRPFFDQKQASRSHKIFINSGQQRPNERGSDDLSRSFKDALISYNFDASFNVNNIFHN